LAFSSLTSSVRSLAPRVRDARIQASGIAFGSSSVGMSENSTGSALRTPRQRDRRQAFADLFGTLLRAMDRRQDVSLMRGAFEETVRRMVPVRSVQLRDAGSKWSARAEENPGTESIALEVPGSDASASGVLHATFDPASALGEWDFQQLGICAQVGAMVLEIERLRLEAIRAGLGPAARSTRDAVAPLIGTTPVMQALRESIERLAATDFTILIEGESGVGKELVARQIHEVSRRRGGPFVAINCAALVETLLEAELFGIEEKTATGVRGRRGKFEAADGGTLFLDEVGDLSLSAQAKLLRAIQDLAVQRVGSHGLQRVDIRIVAATNQHLADLVARRLFRADLFYRLSGVDLRVPNLRERRPDIIELAEYFLARHRPTRSVRLTPVVSDALIAYDWPGNVRELERLMERLIALAPTDRIDLDDLPAAIRGWHGVAVGPSLRRHDTLRVWARRYVRLMLEECGGNKSKAARVLDISQHTLRSYLQEPEEEKTAAVDITAARESVSPGVSG
jgi:two-component system, NtrC family, response regulator HydG